MDKINDLSKGVIWKQITIFALPILLGNLLQNFYNSVDSLVVGNFVGTNALAAVSSCSMISNILVGFFTGLSAGSSVLFARFFGMNDYKNLKVSIHTAILFTIIIGIFMAFSGVGLSSLLLVIVECPAEVYSDALLYLKIYFIGILFTAIYNVGSGILRSVGDSRTPFYYLIISSFVNIILDVVFVCYFNIGVAGVGIATVISQLISVILIFYKLINTTTIYKLELKYLKINKEMLSSLINLGLPAGLQMCLISISNLFVQKYINGFGSAAMAGVGVAQKLDKFAGMPCQAVGLALTTFTSQNLGAGKDERIKKGIFVSFIICLISISIIGLPMYFKSDWLISFFSDDIEVITYGKNMMRLIVPLYFTMAINNIFSGVVRGYGNSKAVMFLSVFGMVIFRQIYLFAAMKIYRSIYHIYIGFPLAWFVSGILIMIYYYLKIANKKMAI